MKDPPVLIVFCREPVPGQTKARLLTHLSACDAATLARAFIEDTLAKASRVGPSKLIIAGTGPTQLTLSPFFHELARRFSADLIDQGAGSLGERMARVMEPFAAGPGSLLVGTDLPSLPFGAFRRLYELLRRRRLVLGPSLDGGYYAIGVRGPMPPVFTKIRWGSSTVLRATLRRINAAGRSVALGPVWYDVDRWPDVLLLSGHLKRIEVAAGLGHPCPVTAGVLRRLGLLPRRRYSTIPTLAG